MITSRGYFTGFITPPVRRDQLEYPTEDVSFIYLLAIDKARIARRGGNYFLETFDWFPDKAVYDTIGDGGELYLRSLGSYYYKAGIYVGATTEDFQVWKSVGGTFTKLGSEAVDLPSGIIAFVKFSVLGSTLKGYRDDMTTPKITVTDTDITNGRVGVLICRTSNCTSGFGALLLAPSSPSSRPIAYFEVPIVGSGTEEDPYRAQLPEMIQGGVNLLALTHSSLIKTGADGKPTQYIAILRVFEQPDRSPSLAPISKALEALKNLPGVRQLDRETAIREAKRLDDKLHDLDLRSARELRLDRRKAGKEYKDWRVYNLGIKEELIEDEIQERYAEEDKGW